MSLVSSTSWRTQRHRYSSVGTVADKLCAIQGSVYETIINRIVVEAQNDFEEAGLEQETLQELKQVGDGSSASVAITMLFCISQHLTLSFFIIPFIALEFGGLQPSNMNDMAACAALGRGPAKAGWLGLPFDFRSGSRLYLKAIALYPLHNLFSTLTIFGTSHDYHESLSCFPSLHFVV